MKPPISTLKVLATAALAGLTTFAGTQAIAAGKLAAQAPLGSRFALEIPDTASFWQKAHALPLSQGIDQFMASPTITANLDYQQFDLERAKMAQTLGFPVTPDELLGNVFSSVLLYAPAKEGNNPDAVVLILGVKDKAKATKLLQAIDQQNMLTGVGDTSASQVNGAMSAPAAAPKGTLEKIKVNSLTVSHFHQEAPGSPTMDGYYALVGDNVVFSNTQSGFTAASGGAPAAPISGDANFAKLRAVLKWDAADATGWMDADAIAQSSLASLNPLLSAIPGAGGQNKVAMTMQVTPSGIFSKSASTADPAAGSPGIKPTTLRSLGLIAQSPLVAVISGSFDLGASITEMKSLGALAALMPNMAAGGPSPVEQFEAATKVSVQQELIPAVGNEIALGINSIKPPVNSPLPVPVIDLIVSVKVRNQAAMQGVMVKLEAYFKEALSGMGAPQQDPTTGATVVRDFQTIKGSMGDIRTYDLGFPGIKLAPSYALLPDMLLISINAENVKAAMGRLGGAEPALGTSPLYTQLTKAAGTTEIYNYAQVDMTGLIGFIGSELPLLANFAPQVNQAQLQQLLGGVLAHLGTASSLETRESNVTVSYGQLIMQ